ncbi:MAG: MFS transporter [Armatimonadota bacterium]|nr:MFS transporter [Armatimonadota bacterium]
MQEERKIAGVSRTVFILGIVSLLQDVSSEMLVPIVPQFLKFAIGATTPIIGLIEGIAESTAALLRVWAGYAADKFGRPKLLAVIGYGLSAISKPFFAAASSWGHVLAIRFADRFGKGIRSAPRDVLIADSTADSERGRAFGLHRAMDTAGAMLGPLVVAVLVLTFFGQRFLVEPGREHRALYNLIFAAAALPAVLSWLVLVLFVREKERPLSQANKPEIRISALELDRRFRLFLGIVTLFSIGNSSDAFLVLRATGAPIKMEMVSFLWVYVVFNAVSALVALRSGLISDKIGRKPVVVAGWLVFALVYLGMARANSQLNVWVLFLLYGVYYGLTEGMLRALAIDLAPAHLRGTAVGAYFTFTGLALLPASVIAGLLWKHFGPPAPFYYGAVTSLVSALLLGALVKPDNNTSGTVGP